VNDAGYLEIKTPMIMDRSLWEASGHWQNYRENMFTTESEKRDYAIKPMNCPGHVQVFNHGCARIAICRCVTRNSVRATAMSRRARCTA
jgi:Threonyl-tRNA synthetase